MDYRQTVSLIDERSLAGRLRLIAGTVYGFSDGSFLEFQLKPSPEAQNRVTAECDQVSGSPYQGNVNDFVDRALAKSTTVGLSVDSVSITDHLKATGTFKFEKGIPVEYRRKDRAYHVF